ncbi:MAG: 50S ribosomal protein L25 [Candidatus Saccharibacteria bacterium]|nr:50S ribosomal protein L25 [Candidatus Saccharibacteria bacterium]
MSNDSITLKVEERSVQGKAVKQLRATGMIPAVIHDHGKESRIVMAPHNEMLKIYQQVGKHHPLSLLLGKQNYMALIKDVDFDPKKSLMRHVVFNAVKQDEKVETEVPVHLVGEIPAEKTGLMVIRSLDHVDIEALPKDLIDSLEVDATSLVAIGDKVFVSDIKPPAGVTILTEPEHPIAAVEETKAQMSEEATEEAAEAASANNDKATESSEEE